ncbi:MAG: NHLP bacteriocin system secretion protein [Acidobacteria bacterium]|nr:MAG: NHLP bacteriocin system secretion protein [Acidobacteriota bacterium]
MMTEEPKKIFRTKALERLSSPEELDQVLQIVTRKSWIPLASLGGLLLIAIWWSISGQIPVTVEGVGLLVYPRQIVSFQLPASGQVVDLTVKVGDFVHKGQILGRINQPALQQNLDQERVRLAELQERNSKIVPLRDKKTDLEKQANERERRILKERIESVLRTAESQKAKNEVYFKKQQEALQQLREVKLTLDKHFKERYDSFESLRKDGIISNDAALNARQDYINNQVQIADLELQIHESELQQLRAEESFQQQLDLVANLQTQLRDLEIKAQEIDQQQLETNSATALQIQEVERTIARYEEDLRTKSQIVNEYTGRILEITASAGQIVSAGQRMGAIETEDPHGKLLAVGYFQVSDGKKIEPGMDVRISPATVERERYGSILGKIVSVSPFPVTTEAITNVVGNAEVAQVLSAGGTKIEVFADLSTDPSSLSGYRWTSGKGPDIKITAGTTGGLRTTVEYRRPITFIIPILRRWSGA